MPNAANIAGWFGAGLAAIMVLLTILPVLPTNAWWIRDMGFPRFQILLLLLIASIPLVVWFRDARLFIGIAGLLAALFQIYQVFPYTSLAPVESYEAELDDPDRRVRLMVANVLMSNRSSRPLIDIVEEYDPDIFLALETDRWWIAEIGNALKDRYPYRIQEPLENTYGMILLSRNELIEPHVRYLVQDTVPSIISDVRLPNGGMFRLYGIHPTPPIPGVDTEERDAELMVVAKLVDKSDLPAIVFGDLNDVAWSGTTRQFRHVGKMLDPRRGRGTYSTFHADYRWLRYPLDHIFHSKEFRLVEMVRLPAWGSDHFPFGAEFSFEPEGDHEQPVPTADAQDEQEAEEQIEEGMLKGR